MFRGQIRTQWDFAERENSEFRQVVTRYVILLLFFLRGGNEEGCARENVG